MDVVKTPASKGEKAVSAEGEIPNTKTIHLHDPWAVCLSSEDEERQILPIVPLS